MTKHPLGATFEHFDEPMSTEFRLTLRARLLADLGSVDDSRSHTYHNSTTPSLTSTKYRRSSCSRRWTSLNGPESRTKLLVGIAAVTVVAVGIGALLVNRRSAEELVTTDNSSVSVSPSAETTARDDGAVRIATANRNSSLKGLWTTGPVPIDQITTAMLRSGLTQEVVDAWIAEVGATTEYTFDLKFDGDDFSHFEQSPGVKVQVDETGTFVYNEGKLELTVGDQGDTYTFSTVMVCCESLQLRLPKATGNGTAQDNAEFARLIAAYTSAPFQRRPFP